KHISFGASLFLSLRFANEIESGRVEFKVTLTSRRSGGRSSRRRVRPRRRVRVTLWRFSSSFSRSMWYFNWFSKVSRQEYLKKMEQKKLKELRDDIEDEQYLFDGVKLIEYGELRYVLESHSKFLVVPLLVRLLAQRKLLSVNNFKEDGDNDWFMDSWHLPHIVSWISPLELPHFLLYIQDFAGCQCWSLVGRRVEMVVKLVLIVREYCPWMGVYGSLLVVESVAPLVWLCWCCCLLSAVCCLLFANCGEALQDERINGGAFIGTDDSYSFPSRKIATKEAISLKATSLEV
ncbi:hypothetical protein HYC85_002664, partial [Camellia sinensis]